MSLQQTGHNGVPKFAPADDYTPFCEAVRALCGVDLLQYKRAQMERRIRTWTARRGTDDLAEYGKRLKADSDELDAFLDRVTINVSQLWRHPEQWNSLATEILPELAERGRVRAWSAGCSYGAEAYTLAAVCREAIPNTRVEIKGALVASVLAGRAASDDIALVLDSDLTVEGEDCSISFVLVPSKGGVQELLTRLGLGD